MKYGSAVLTALQAQHMSLDEIGDLIPYRRLKAFIAGGDSEEWLSCFWKNMAVLRHHPTIEVRICLRLKP